MTIEVIAVLIIIVAIAIRILCWFAVPIRPSPDPWGPEVERMLHDPELPALCHRCLTPQGSGGWFCPTCGASIGPFNNYMPYLYIFSQGEVLRAGASDHIRRSPLTVGGYLLFSLASYSILAPVYWYRLFRNLKRHDEEGTEDSGKQT
jgi:hypothetical protein